MHASESESLCLVESHMNSVLNVITIDVVKVKGEDPDTPGYVRGDRVRLGRRRSRIVGASPLARSQ